MNHVDKPSQRLYTEDDLSVVAHLAAQKAIREMLHAPPNLDNGIEKEYIVCPSEGEEHMSSPFRETYSYVDEYGATQTVRFNGKTKQETDAKFQAFLCGPKIKKAAPTLRHYVDATYRKSFINGLAATTKATYEDYLRRYILQYMGDMPMDQITLGTIQRFYDWLAEKKAINEKSISRVGGLLSRILTIAAEMKIIQESPFKAKLLKNNGKPAGHHKALPDELVAMVKKKLPLLIDEQQRLYMGLLVYTGLRREEILGLGWEHLDLHESYGSVQRVVVYPDNNHPFIKDKPKTEHSERSFIIPQPLLDILKPVDHRAAFIIHGEDSSKPIAMSSFEKMQRKAFKLLGIQGYNNHDWRTTFGTQLKEAGMTSAQVADMMGHADTRMVETVYARRRHEGVMKHKNTVERLNQDYTRGTSVVPKKAI